MTENELLYTCKCINIWRKKYTAKCGCTTQVTHVSQYKNCQNNDDKSKILCNCNYQEEHHSQGPQVK